MVLTGKEKCGMKKEEEATAMDTTIRGLSRIVSSGARNNLARIGLRVVSAHQKQTCSWFNRSGS